MRMDIFELRYIAKAIDAVEDVGLEVVTGNRVEPVGMDVSC